MSGKTVSQNTLKSYKSKINWGTQTEGLPFSQGMAIKRVMQEVDGVIAWGYEGSYVGLETRQQYLFWRDMGGYLEFKGILNKTNKEKTSKATKNKADMSTPLFDINTVEEEMEKIRKGLNFPYVQVSKDTLGGDKHVTIMIRISKQPKEDWSYNIFQNSPHANISIERNRTVECFGGRGLKMRKFKAKSIEQAIEKINAIKEK